MRRAKTLRVSVDRSRSKSISNERSKSPAVKEFQSKVVAEVLDLVKQELAKG